MYKTLNKNEVSKFLSEKSSKVPYTMVGHQWAPLKHVGKMYCKGCGLVRLNNPFTVWCIDKGCNHENHSQYISVRSKLTKPEWLY